MATARKLPSGNWRVRIPAEKDEFGKWKYKSFTAATKKEAEYLANSYSRSNKESRNSYDMLLKDAYTRYIESRIDILSPNTIVGYFKCSRNDFPELMEKKIGQLTQEEIQRAVGRMAKTHSPKSVRNSHGLLSAVLKEYRSDFILHTRLPQKVKPKIYVPTDREIKTVEEYVKGRSMEIPFLLATFGPMRREEICAVTFGDLKGNKININKAYAKNYKGSWILKGPKTENGYREISFPQFVIDKIKEKGIGSPEDRICPMFPTTLTNYWILARKKLDINQSMRFHDLRHYAASRMHAMGIPDQYVCDRGGWDIISLQQIYQHILTDHVDDFTDKINATFSEVYDTFYAMDYEESAKQRDL